MINFMYMINDVIAESFTRRVGRWQGEIGSDGKPSERKALLTCFKIKKESVQMLIHAPANYVGVYTRKGKGKWNCICYHDSCWTSDGVEHFLWQHREDICFSLFPVKEGFDIIETLVNSIHIVKLTEAQLDELKQVRKKKHI